MRDNSVPIKCLYRDEDGTYRDRYTGASTDPTEEELVAIAALDAAGSGEQLNNVSLTAIDGIGCRWAGHGRFNNLMELTWFYEFSSMAGM